MRSSPRFSFGADVHLRFQKEGTCPRFGEFASSCTIPIGHAHVRLQFLVCSAVDSARVGCDHVDHGRCAPAHHADGSATARAREPTDQRAVTYAHLGVQDTRWLVHRRPRGRSHTPSRAPSPSGTGGHAAACGFASRRDRHADRRRACELRSLSTHSRCSRSGALGHHSSRHRRAGSSRLTSSDRARVWTTCAHGGARRVAA